MDLKNQTQFNFKGVSQLIVSKDDSQDRQLRVDTNGIAYISDEVANENLTNLSFRFETWDTGDKNTGLEASQNIQWVNRIYEALKKNWPNPTKTYIDMY